MDALRSQQPRKRARDAESWRPKTAKGAELRDLLLSMDDDEYERAETVMARVMPGLIYAIRAKS